MTGISNKVAFSWLRALLPGGVLTFVAMASVISGLVDPGQPVVLLLVAAGWLTGVAWAGSRVRRDSGGTTMAGDSGDGALLKYTGCLLKRRMSGDIAATREQLQAARHIVQQAGIRLTAGFEKLTSGSRTDELNEVVLGLQFEDLVTQAMVAADYNLQSLRRVECLLDRLLQLWPETDSKAFADLKHEVEALSAVEGRVPPPAIAASLPERGDVELF